MRALLRSLYRSLPLSPAAKQRLRGWIPYRLLQPNPALRRYGAVHDLYPWRTDESIDTCFYIQNFYSVYFPELDTATRLSLQCFDANGELLGERRHELPARSTLPVSMKDWLSVMGSSKDRGTAIWHIELPEAVARRPECLLRHAYFSDRGYFAFIKNGTQPSFVHGIDRYAVYQHGAGPGYDHFYPSGEEYSWFPEIPLGSALGCAKLDVITMNRSSLPASLTVEVLGGDKAVRSSYHRELAPRGLFLHSIEGKSLEGLEDRGSLRVSGLPTQWTRVIAMRHFPSGAISAMHC